MVVLIRGLVLTEFGYAYLHGGGRSLLVALHEPNTYIQGQQQLNAHGLYYLHW